MYQLPGKKWVKHLDFIILETLVLVGVYVALCSISIRGQWWNVIVYRSAIFVIPIMGIIWQLLHNFHRDVLKGQWFHDLFLSFVFVSVDCISLIVLQYLMKSIADFSRQLYLLLWVLGTIFVFLVRIIYKKLLIKTRMRHFWRPNVVLVTDKPQNQDKIQQLQKEHLRYHFDTMFSSSTDASFTELNVLDATQESFTEYRKHHRLDEVFLDIESKSMLEDWIFMVCESGLPVHIFSDNIFDGLRNIHFENIGDCTVLTASDAAVYPAQLIVKRAMDIFGGIIGLLITGIAILIFGRRIKKESGGSMFYTQNRIGRNGKVFKIYKFRSMYVDADQRREEILQNADRDSIMFKMENDPRIIPIGHFIRKHSIDELPQFLNVLKGDMSLVGTRPPLPEEWKLYETHHLARMGTKPGLTGMWQVSGRSNIDNFDEVCKLDMKYIREWSLLLDVQLILKTIKIVLIGEGAY